MLRLTPSIDHDAAEWFARLQTLPPEEQCAIRAAIICGIRTETIAEVPDVLLAIDPVLAALWGRWQETLSTAAWRAVIVTVRCV